MQGLDLGKEIRSARGFELRSADDDGLVSFSGYASVTGLEYEVGGGPEAGGWIEVMERGAFRATLGRPTNRALLLHHDGTRVLATTRSGHLSIEEDSVGLRVEARLDPGVTWIGDLIRQIEAGTIDEMSIGFYTRRASWLDEYSRRVVHEVMLVETTITWAGANGATVAMINRAKDLVAEARAAATKFDRVRLAAAAAAAQLASH